MAHENRINLLPGMLSERGKDFKGRALTVEALPDIVIGMKKACTWKPSDVLKGRIDLYYENVFYRTVTVKELRLINAVS